MNSLALAYLGDAVFELEARKMLLNQGLSKVNDLHKAAVRMVKATTQAKAMHCILPELDELEAGVVRRGRNAKSGMVPKNTGVTEYRYATALEALVGYWYLTGNQARIRRVFEVVTQLLQQETQAN